MKILLILPITTFLLIVLYAGRGLISNYQVSTTMVVLLFMLVDVLALWFSLAGIKLAVWAAHRFLNSADSADNREAVSNAEYQEVRS